MVEGTDQVLINTENLFTALMYLQEKQICNVIHSGERNLKRNKENANKTHFSGCHGDVHVRKSKKVLH